MFKKMKKILAATLAAGMVLTVLPQTAFAIDLDDGIDSLTELQTVASAADGGSYIINKAITISEAVTLTNVTLDATNVTDVFTVTSGGSLTLGAGVTVTSNTSILYANGGTITVSGAVLTSENSKYALGYADDNGVINVTAGTVSCSGDKVTLDIDDGSTSAISGGTVFSKDSSAIAVRNGSSVTVSGTATVETTASSQLTAIYATNNSEIIVTGGTVKAANEAAVDANDTCKATVSGGTLTSGAGISPVTSSGTGEANVTAGTFYSGTTEVVLDESGEFVPAPVPMPEEKPIIPPVENPVYDVPVVNYSLASIVPANSAAKFEITDSVTGKKISTSVNKLAKALSRVTEGSEITLDVGNFGFVLKKNVVEQIIENDLTVIVITSKATFVVDAENLAKAKTINISSIQKTASFKKLVKEGDTFIVSITEKNKVEFELA